MKYLTLPLIIVLQLISFFAGGLSMVFEFIASGSYKLQNSILDAVDSKKKP